LIYSKAKVAFSIGFISIILAMVALRKPLSEIEKNSKFVSLSAFLGLLACRVVTSPFDFTKVISKKLAKNALATLVCFFYKLSSGFDSFFPSFSGFAYQVPSGFVY
jgi:hypothetical protein